MYKFLQILSHLARVFLLIEKTIFSSGQSDVKDDLLDIRNKLVAYRDELKARCDARCKPIKEDKSNESVA